MAIYWRPSQLPELKHVPKDMHDEVVEAALYSIPVSLPKLLCFGVVMFPLAAVGLGLAITFGIGSSTFISLWDSLSFGCGG